MAKKKQIPTIDINELGLSGEDLESHVEIIKMDSPPPREAGKVIEDEPAAAAKKLVEFLHDESKVI